jgi:hypothetical protein
MKIGIVVPILGLVNMLLLSFQISTGLRWIKVSMAIHRKTGITLFTTAIIHGTLAFLLR